MRKQKYKGRCEKRILSKSDEVCRFYSDLQSKYADKLDSDNGIKRKRQIASTVTFSGGCFAATDI